MYQLKKNMNNTYNELWLTKKWENDKSKIWGCESSKFLHIRKMDGLLDIRFLSVLHYVAWRVCKTVTRIFNMQSIIIKNYIYKKKSTSIFSLSIHQRNSYFRQKWVYSSIIHIKFGSLNQLKKNMRNNEMIQPWLPWLNKKDDSWSKHTKTVNKRFRILTH